MVPTAAGAIRRGVFDVQCVERTIDAEREVVCGPFHGIGQVGMGNLRCIGEPAGDPLQVVVEAGVTGGLLPAALKPTKCLVDPFLRFVMVHAEHAVVRLPEALFICEQHPFDVLDGGEVLLRPV